MMFKRSLLFLIALLFLGTSCAAVQYNTTLRKWTKKGQVYSIETLDAELIWSATYMSDEYRDAAMERINVLKKLPPDAVSKYVDYITDKSEVSFIIAVYVPRGYPTLTANITDFWDLTLDLPSGESLAPSSVVPLTVTPREKKLFPYLNRWSTLYSVKFPVSYINYPFTLALRSPEATSFLKWKQKK